MAAWGVLLQFLRVFDISLVAHTGDRVLFEDNLPGMSLNLSHRGVDIIHLDRSNRATR